MSTQKSTETEETMTTLKVDGMTYNGCVGRLQKVLSKLDRGHKKAIVTLEPGEAKVDGSVSRDSIVAAIEGAGFDVVDPS